MPQKRTSRLIFILIFGVYGVLGVLFATRTPAWQAPDEPAHYNYIRQVVGAFTRQPDGALLPYMQADDWNNAYLEDLKAMRFAPYLLKNLALVQYEDHQPPLYYWASAPFFALSNGNLTILRLVSLAWGAVTLYWTYCIGRIVFPAHENVALGAMALVAFLPQHLMILTSVNNDTLAGAVMAYTLYLCVRYRQDGRVTATRLGTMLGIAFITKTTIYFVVVIVALAVLLRWLATKDAWQRSQHAMGSRFNSAGEREVFALNPLSQLWQPLVVIAMVSSVFALLWWGRNIAVYGFPDFLGLRAHDAVVVGQLRTSDLIAQVGWGDYQNQLISTTFNSYWGQFGWMGVPMIGVFAPNDHIVYPLIMVFLGMALLGLLLLRFNADLRMRYAEMLANDEALQRDFRRILLSVLALSIAVFVYYNTQFVQFQGRYLFSSIVPFALFVALGWSAIGRVLRRPRVVIVIMFGFALLDFWLIWRVLPGALGI
jgi:hypothetical protein